MPQKKQVRLAELKVGIFIVVVLVLFLALILQQSWGLNWFSKSAQVVTYLTDVGGLKPGAPVWLAGIEIGRVRKVSIIPPEAYAGNAEVYRQIEEMRGRLEILEASPESSQTEDKAIRELRNDIRDRKQDIRMVEVWLDIRPEYLDRISHDSEISIESKGLIGDSFIDISPGTFSVPPRRQGDHYVIESVQSAGFREIMTGANDVVANFGVLSENFKNLTQKIASDKIASGVGDILGDTQKTVHQANLTFTRAASLLTAMQEGNGTVGKLVSDPALYNRLVESLEKFNSLADNIQKGNGSLGKLINDPALFDSASATLKKAEAVMTRIEKGEGTLGKLSTDDALYVRTAAALDRFAALTEELDRGEGTLGKLLKDPGLYNNLDQSTAEVSKLLYDIRKDPKKFLTIRFRIF
ncbi:MAG: MlaD family protein [Acidobacteriota bacterium]|jgi:phospholipid/cholesterol/gamma-HCH transport system substrate-binding protein|nr:MlaD family protein [Acidobacteriota bacterium]